MAEVLPLVGFEPRKLFEHTITIGCRIIRNVQISSIFHHVFFCCRKFSLLQISFNSTWFSTRHHFFMKTHEELGMTSSFIYGKAKSYTVSAKISQWVHGYKTLQQGL